MSELKFPEDTFKTRVRAMVKLLNWSAVAFAVIITIAGAIYYFKNPIISYVLFITAGIIVVAQGVSRMEHVKQLSALCVHKGELAIRDRRKERWVHSSKIESFGKIDSDYAPPWGGKARHYPGIEIELEGVEDPVEHLYPKGLTTERDEMFAYLLEKFPDKMVVYEDEVEREEEKA